MRRSPYDACSDPGGGGIHHPDRMREARVPITSRAECQTVYTAAGAPIDATMLCAGRTNLDTCQGDSGGPLFFKAAGPGHRGGAGDRRPGGLTSGPGAQPVPAGWAPARPRW
jgi:secreted trypsin-like serine protease